MCTDKLIKLIQNYHLAFKEKGGDFDNYRGTKKYNARVNYHHKKMVKEFEALGINNSIDRVNLIQKYRPN